MDKKQKLDLRLFKCVAYKLYGKKLGDSFVRKFKQDRGRWWGAFSNTSCKPIALARRIPLDMAPLFVNHIHPNVREAAKMVLSGEKI